MSGRVEPEGITSTFLSLRAGLRQFLLRYLIRREDVEDIVQGTFLRAYEAERRRKIDFPRTFLFTVARNIALSEIQRKGARVTCYIGDLEELELADEQCLEDVLDTQQRLDAMFEIVASLPRQCRRVLIMQKMLGFSREEVGERLDISPRTVEKHVAKGLERCRDARNPALR